MKKEVIIKRFMEILRSNKDHDTIQKELMQVFLEDMKVSGL